MIDVDAYFSRIGYGGPSNASLETLCAIHALHPAAIPFENLDPLLGRPVPLHLAALQEKMLRRRRGGYCFEQNALFKAVLEALGFSVAGLAARVRWRLPPDAPANPRTHMLLKLDLAEGTFIADVGFGGLLFAAPLRLVADVEQGLLRLQRQRDGAFTVQARLASGWQDAYRFTLEQQFPADYEVANWFTAAHPNSRFRNNLLMERLTPALRLSLFNRKVTRRFADGRVEETTLADAGGLARLLADEFEIEPPADAASVFARLPPA